MAPTIISRLRGKGGNDSKKNAKIPLAHRFVETSYTSLPVDIPSDFLIDPAHDAQPIIKTKINFEDTTLPEYAGHYAVILDNALSFSECTTLLRLAEASAGVTTGGDGWRPAMVNAGQNVEVLATDYRNSDRIIWDSTEIAERLWRRCLTAEGIAEELGTIENNPAMQGKMAIDSGEKWKVTRLNERLRFLKYGPGQFFGSHCDGSYVNPDPNKVERSHYTLHLYLNDNGLQGGSTPFFSKDLLREENVEAKLGRILIFQHRNLTHSGKCVLNGTKYTMRTDLMFEKCSQEDERNTVMKG